MKHAERSCDYCNNYNIRSNVWSNTIGYMSVESYLNTVHLPFYDSLLYTELSMLCSVHFRDWTHNLAGISELQRVGKRHLRQSLPSSCWYSWVSCHRGSQPLERCTYKRKLLQLFTQNTGKCIKSSIIVWGAYYVFNALHTITTILPWCGLPWVTGTFTIFVGALMFLHSSLWHLYTSHTRLLHNASTQLDPNSQYDHIKLC